LHRTFLQPFQPRREKNIVDRVFGTVERDLGIQQSFFAQGIGEALYGGWGADFHIKSVGDEYAEMSVYIQILVKQ